MMPVDREVEQIKHRGVRYTFRYSASADEWVPVNQNGSLRASRVPGVVWEELKRRYNPQKTKEKAT